MNVFLIILFIILCLVGFIYSNIKNRNSDKKEHKQNYSLSEQDKEFMAYHEAGHAIVYEKLFGKDSLHLITIDPSTEEFGAIKFNLNKNYNQTYEELIALIAVSLSGRLSEDFFLKEKTTSLIHDLSTANFFAYEMVSKFGMGKLTGLYKIEKFNELSEEMKSNVEKDILSILDEAHTLAHNIIVKNRKQILELKDLLLIKKTLDHFELLRFFDK